MPINVKFKELLPKFVADEFDYLTTSLKSIIFKEHNSDGTHTDITAESLELTSGVVGSFSAPDQPICQVLLDTPQTLTTGVGATIQWTVPAADTPQSAGGFDKFHMYSGGYFVPPEPGIYLVSAEIMWEAGAGGTRRLSLHCDDLNDTLLAVSFQDGSAGDLTQQVSKVVVWPNNESGNSRLFWVAKQDSGGDLDIVTTFRASWAQVLKLA